MKENPFDTLPQNDTPAGAESADAVLHGIASLYGLDLGGYRTITGDPAHPNTIHGSDGNDVIVAGHGNDSINGVRGDDVIIGGDGHGTLYGGFGADILYAGRGDNVLAGFGSDGLPGGHPPPWPYLQNNGPDSFVFDIKSSDPNYLGRDLVWDLTPDDHLVFHDLDRQVQSAAALDRLVTVTGEGQHVDISWKNGGGDVQINLQNGPPEAHLGNQYHSMANLAAHFHVDFVQSNSAGDWHFV